MRLHALNNFNTMEMYILDKCMIIIINIIKTVCHSNTFGEKILNFISIMTEQLEKFQGKY